MMTSNRSGLKGGRTKTGISDTWITIDAMTRQINSRAVRLLIPTSLHDQNFLKMGEVGGGADRHGLENSVFPTLDHGYLANWKPFWKNSAYSGCYNRIPDFNIFFAGCEFKGAEHLAFAFDDAPGAGTLNCSGNATGVIRQQKYARG